MTIYTHSYFSIRIEFPEDWSAHTYSNGSLTKIKGKNILGPNPCSDIDRLNIDEGHIDLFFAASHQRRRHGISSSLVSLSVCRRSGDLNLSDEVEKKPNEKKRELGTLDIFGVRGKSLYLIDNNDGYLLRRRVVSWEEKPGVWLVAFCSGDTLENFKLAEAVMTSLVRI